MKKFILVLCLPLSCFAGYMDEINLIDNYFMQAPAKKVEKKAPETRKRQPVRITDLEELYFEDQINIRASGIKKELTKKKVRSR